MQCHRFYSKYNVFESESTKLFNRKYFRFGSIRNSVSTEKIWGHLSTELLQLTRHFVNLFNMYNICTSEAFASSTHLNIPFNFRFDSKPTEPHNYDENQFSKTICTERHTGRGEKMRTSLWWLWITYVTFESTVETLTVQKRHSMNSWKICVKYSQATKWQFSSAASSRGVIEFNALRKASGIKFRVDRVVRLFFFVSFPSLAIKRNSFSIKRQNEILWLVAKFNGISPSCYVKW